MKKAIYGLAQPFREMYISDTEAGTLIERTNKESVYFDNVVVLTTNHEYDRVAGTTEDGLLLQVTDDGIFFKLTPNTAAGRSLWKKVKRNALRYCSLSYLKLEVKRNKAEEKKITQAFKAIGRSESIRVEDHQRILVFEICLCNLPANEYTFCTIDQNDPRLKGVNFDHEEPIPIEHQNDESKGLFMKYVELGKDITQLANDVKEFKKTIRRL